MRIAGAINVPFSAMRLFFPPEQAKSMRALSDQGMTSGVLSQARWLNQERVLNYARLLCLGYAIATVAWIALSPGCVDPNGKPLGTDFIGVWTAGKLALLGDPAGAYDYARHYAVQRDALPWPDPQAAPYFGWHYPPIFLLVAVLLARLPYGAALAAWMLLTVPLYLLTIRAIAPHRHWLLLATAFPGAFINLGHGQNGFLTTSLFGGGILLLETRPALAGVLLGFLCYKPQFGLLIPLALAVGGYWRTFASATLTVLVLAAISYFVFGLKTWEAFYSSLSLTQGYVLEQGATGWEKIQSTFSALRMLGFGIRAAYAAQGLVTLFAAAAVIYVWRRPVSLGIKGSALATASLLATPYILDYDLVVLALPLAWMIAEAQKTGPLAWEKIGLAATFVLPLLSRSIGGLGLPLAPIVMVVLLSLIVRRARFAESRARSPLVAQCAPSTP